MSTPDSSTALEIRPIPGLRGYYARQDGVIFSTKMAGSPLGRLVPMSQARILRPQPDGCTGYLKVNLSVNNKTVTRRIHTLVLCAFIGPAPLGAECRHLDSNKFNNRLSNLQWAMRIENMQDRIAAGTSNRGTTGVSAKLNEDQVREIRRRRLAGESSRHIAKEYGVCRATIDFAISGRNWGWLSD
jgi:hypothetical protein